MTSRLTLFFCEFITAGGMCDAPLEVSLLNEGRLMRDAVLKELVALDQYNIVTMHDARIDPEFTFEGNASVNSIAVHLGAFNDRFESMVDVADLVWIIAPESDGILLDLMCYVAQHTAKLIGCGVETARIASNKLLTFNHLAQHGIHAVNTINGPQWHAKKAKQMEEQWLAKPIDGVGCDGIQLFESTNEVDLWLPEDNRFEQYCIQPFHAGQAASLSMLCKHGRAWLLSCNAQTVEITDNTLVLTAITINGMEKYWQRFAELANAIAAAMPDAVGYLGVDLMIDTQHDEISVLEINPRLTTSYVALSEATGVNISALLLDCHISPTFTMPPIQRNVVTLTLS